MISDLENTTTLVSPKVSKGKKQSARTLSVLTDFYLDPGLLDLVRLRVAQMHDCKSCVREHLNKLKAKGETERRLRLLKNWRTQAVFSTREEAALNLTEAMTHQPIDSVPQKDFQIARIFFNENEMICLTLAILAVNDWHYLNPRGASNGSKTKRPPHE